MYYKLSCTTGKSCTREVHHCGGVNGKMLSVDNDYDLTASYDPTLDHNPFIHSNTISGRWSKQEGDIKR